MKYRVAMNARLEMLARAAERQNGEVYDKVLARVLKSIEGLRDAHKAGLGNGILLLYRGQRA